MRRFSNGCRKRDSVLDCASPLLLINRRFETLYHFKREDVIGKTDHDLFPKEIADAFRLSDRKALEAGRLWNGKRWARTTTESIRILRTSFLCSVQKEEPVRCVWVFD